MNDIKSKSASNLFCNILNINDLLINYSPPLFETVNEKIDSIYI